MHNNADAMSLLEIPTYKACFPPFSPRSVCLVLEHHIIPQGIYKPILTTQKIKWWPNKEYSCSSSLPIVNPKFDKCWPLPISMVSAGPKKKRAAGVSKDCRGQSWSSVPVWERCWFQNWNWWVFIDCVYKHSPIPPFPTKHRYSMCV